MTAQPTNGSLFTDEIREMLAELDSALLEMERVPGSTEPLARVFRALHTLKGACDMFGLSGAVAVLHDMESLWDQVRSGLMPASRRLVDLTLAVKDWMEPVAGTQQDPDPDEALVAAMTALCDQTAAGGPEAVPATPSATPAAPQGTRKTYRIVLAPSDPGHLAKLDPASLIEELSRLGNLETALDTGGVPRLEDLDTKQCRLRWEMRLTTAAGADAVRDVFLFLDNPADAAVEELEHAGEHAPARGETAAKPASAPPGASVPDSPACREAPPPPAPGKPAASQTLRVETAKLDNLVNLVGELVIAQARLSQISAGMNSTALTGVAEEIERLVVELRDNTLGIRMLPIGTTFSRFRRLVRDLSAELGKEIELSAEGGETELDKTVIEQLGDPLVHMLRNSIDHGIETPAERTASGKPPRGLIRLAAKQAGGAVVIRIEDDGRGLDAARIRAKAVERGVIPHDARLGVQEIHQLVFAPGFSTAEKVTSVSGRGVGMDVVKRSIESLRGTVDIESAQGKGTAMVVTLPLTLAIIDGLQVRVGEELYIIPLSMVEECVELALDERTASGRNRTLHVRGEIVPYLRLRETFQLGGERPAVEQVVVTRHENGRTGIAVDEVIGQQQTVIKNLGRLIGRVEGISGATINGDGTMALILDVPRLAENLEREAGS
ncbi:MAG: chemotaxis protein CheA [Thermodesulfobacteriota bacterium]